MADLLIEYVEPGSLVPAPYNPRTMSDDARARLRRGIEEFGLVDPLVVRRADRLVVGGHQRLSVALDLGLSTVPVVFLDDLDDQRAAALNILLNNPSAQGAWDFPKLTDILSTLDGEGFDTTLTAFSPEDLSNLLAPEAWDVGEPKGAVEDTEQDYVFKVRCKAVQREAVETALESVLTEFPGVTLE